MNRRAFSIVELMVVIAIIGVLISILLPALGAARSASRQVLALANARTLHQTFELYLDSNDETYPFVPGFADPNLGGEQVVFVNWYPEGTVIGTNDRFMLAWAWPALISTIAPWEEHYETWVSPGKPTELPEDWVDSQEREPGEEISWRLSNTFLADPAAWDGKANADPMVFRAVKRPDIAFPSGKALAWDTHLAYLSRRPDLRDGHWDADAPIAFADGHAEVRNPLDGTEPADTGFGFSETGPRALADTPDGVRGLDY
ncbi:MAG: type II secretion system protein [Planctomycetota bacterium]